MFTPHEKRQLLKLIEKMPTTTPCPDCINWDVGSCRLWKEKIPEDIVDVGCPEWKFDPNAIPF